MFELLFQRVYHLQPAQIFVGILITCAAVGFASSIIVPLFFQLLDNTKRARARQRRMMPAQAQAHIDRLSRRLLEAHDRETLLRKENHELRRLVAAEANFGRNHRADVQATLKEVAGGKL